MNALRILIADDDTLVLKLLGQFLEKHGYTVIRAQDGYQALQLTREHEPDLAILDVNMPAGDGFSVLERMKKMASLMTIPVVYMTAERSERIEASIEALRPRGIIYKPFTEDDIIELLREVLPAPKDEAA